MGAAGNTEASMKIWRSPIPYLFGGIGLVLFLIAMALILLVCSHRKPSSRSLSQGDEEKPESPITIMVESAEPKILVVMAGDDHPTYLAMPAVTCAKICRCDQL
ncbi:protein GLUTAMINE DUMPER 6-like [Carica papaya]|uniref:protein GLUTAMINE DUMPER 6-like n=1 Tax=Carica papaya TaxID=3649 RepID=UPI000B8D002F|nr:protein GLUTAMINE DUMPER 6-like [Carica papaya]